MDAVARRVLFSAAQPQAAAHTAIQNVSLFTRSYSFTCYLSGIVALFDLHLDEVVANRDMECPFWEKSRTT